MVWGGDFGGGGVVVIVVMLVVAVMWCSVGGVGT